MTIKEYCRNNHISAKEVSLSCGIPYSTVNDLFNGKTSLSRTSFDVICRIADALSMDLSKFRRLFIDGPGTKDRSSDLQIIVRNKRYYLLWEGRRYYICKVNTLNSRYVNDLAELVYEEEFVKKQLEEANAVLLNARK